MRWERTGSQAASVAAVERTVLATAPGAAVRLYCLPPAGAGPEFFQGWAGHLPAGVELCSLSLPGRGERRNEPSLTDAECLSARIAAVVDDWADPRPFALFGHSVGALLAFETTRHLRRRRGRLPVLLGLSALAAPHLNAYTAALPSCLTTGLDGLANLVGGPIPQHLVDDPQLMAAACTPLLADALLLLQYRHRTEEPLDVPLALFGGTQDPLTPLADLRAWNDLVTVPAEPRLFPGAHMYPAQEVAGLAGEVVRCLDAVAPMAALA
ncbi:thioesterase II family protein (plasmid) [Streptomyces sp. CA-294286]|uniref:thioesterase II family protein n=1 Tax=Streptomyces sp. CA-294286 TaxID=3240070 RepID=UPI003D8A3575